MHIAVLGDGGRRHRADHAAIVERFAGSRWEVRRFRIEDRAGRMPKGLGGEPTTLAGCRNFGSRPLEHLHVTATGRVALCCEDYDERHVLGELNRQSIAEVLSGPEIAALRREIYGLEAPRNDLLCRRCYFAREARAGLGLIAVVVGASHSGLVSITSLGGSGILKVRAKLLFRQ